ncbi:hypothetical protein AK812_SmicGene19831 [Symbiodinium microadriaticum]|uniref:Uncharacterized protein n=1 Tax=Symbiodinium microadriaticum TaxID=2951 RepID=A0A1Q9DRK4_SYMMI|nr:hypothetical protein AK812_SmicGene19831 [Symbiodinium microadriaticum]
MQGLRPRIRSISRDNEADLVALGESQTVTPTRAASKSRDLLSSPLAEVDLGIAGHVRIEAGYDERELNEVLSFNASIYDLTIQYSCLACTGCGEGQDATVLLNLVLFLGLQVGNVFLQMFLLFEIEFLIAFPAMEHARDLYDRFTDHCYGEGLMDSSEDVGVLFQSWDGTAKAELCQFPLTNPTFFFMVILIWTFFLGHELKQTVYFFWHTLRLHRPTEGCVCIVDHQDQSQFVITHMSGLLKFWIALIVFLPKFIIAIVLWYIGARWLTATPGVDNLMLNSLALTFICELDELIFRTCTSENIKACLERTKLPMAPLPAGPSKAGAIETAFTVVGCFALAFLYLTHFQTAIPEYRWDLAGLCRGHHRTVLNLISAHHGKRHCMFLQRRQPVDMSGCASRQVVMIVCCDRTWGLRGLFCRAVQQRTAEVNPLHVSVARFLLDIAGLSQVRPGQVKDVVPQLVEELGFHSTGPFKAGHAVFAMSYLSNDSVELWATTGVCFMDHRGTIFHQATQMCPIAPYWLNPVIAGVQDFNLLLGHGVLGAEAQLVADNTLNPGANASMDITVGECFQPHAGAFMAFRAPPNRVRPAHNGAAMAGSGGSYWSTLSQDPSWAWLSREDSRPVQGTEDETQVLRVCFGVFLDLFSWAIF